MDSALLQAALEYAELGYPVFPCAPGAKTPITEHGFHDATTDTQLIERWWTEHPAANIAIPTQGLVVVDVDGPENSWLADVPEKLLDLARGAMSLTAGGGKHYIFRQPEGKHWRGTTGKLAKRVDVRAEGNYIVVPPSVLSGGKAYRWADGMALDTSPENLPEPPGWLVESLDEIATSANFPPLPFTFKARPVSLRTISHGLTPRSLGSSPRGCNISGSSQPAKH